MAEVELRCRQCGGTSRVAADRIPRYGARVRCPRCDTLQLVLGGSFPPAAGEDLPAPKAERPAGALRPPVPEPGSASFSPAAPPPAEAAAAQPLPPEPAAAEPPPPEPARVEATGDERAQTAEARLLIRHWLEDLRRQAGEPLDVARVFGAHGEELAHLYSLWSGSHPGERARALFRRELLGALESLASTGKPPSPVQGPSQPGR